MECKRIPIALLKIGMFVTGCDRPWIETPFLAHKFQIKTQVQIDKLIESGIEFVDIDPQRGTGVVSRESTASIQPVPSRSSAAFQVPSEPHSGTLVSGLAEARKARAHMLESVRGVLESVHTSGAVSAAQVKEVAEEVIARTLEHDQALVALIRTREFDPDLYDHALSVGTLTVVLGRLLGYEEKGLEHFAMAALLHDVGLLRLPRNLLKPLRPLSPSDQKVFAMHPQIGMEMLRRTGDMPIEVLQMVAEHHEAPDPGRYADDAARSAVARCSRLLKVVDVYDELLTGQGARPALQPRVALQQLYLDGQQNRLDLEMASHLISQIGVYPVYSFVELNTGHRGIVTRVPPGELLRPVLLLTHGPDHILLEEFVPVNLATLTEEDTRLEIVSVLDPDKENIEVEALLAEWMAR